MYQPSHKKNSGSRFKKKFSSKEGGYKKKSFSKRKLQKKKVPADVKKLMREHNLSFRTAFKVYHKMLTVEQAIDEDVERDHRKAQAQLICKKHRNINLALACLLIKENITPEEFFQQQKERKQKYREREILKKVAMANDQAQAHAFRELERLLTEKIPLSLALYNNKKLDIILENFTPYEFIYQSHRYTRSIHRLRIKYFYAKEHEARIKKWIMTDKVIEKKKLRPDHRATNRYQFPEIVLQKDAEIMLALHEGEMIRGKIVWFTPYDILLETKQFQIWVFRHAVIECALLKKPVKK